MGYAALARLFCTSIFVSHTSILQKHTGEEDPWRWAPAVGNSWRSTDDIAPTWNAIKATFLSSQKHIHRSQHGAWADPDMLQVGNGNLSIVEEMTHFSLWALVKAPLLLGMDLTSLSPEARNIISNKNLIRVNQDPGARPATCFVGCDDSASWSVYATRVTGGDTVAIVVNWNDMELGLLPLGGQDVGVVPSRNEEVTVVDLWTNQVMGTFGFDELKTLPIPSIPAHGSLVYRFLTQRRYDGPSHAPVLNDSLQGVVSRRE
jgi:alpha-galactosidase